MKILIVGSGGREHTLAWKLAQSDLVHEIIVAPGNPGISSEPKCRLASVSADDMNGLLLLAQKEKIDITLVGPEAPLVAGLTDKFKDAGMKVFGPSGAAAMLEGSKVFAKNLMAKYGIPTAEYAVFTDYDEAKEYISSKPCPMVLKADGLAAGKGVLICHSQIEAMAALDLILKDKAFGDAGNTLVIEEFLDGEEASFIAFTDGKTVLPLAGSQDHKAIFDNDAGPNTGGMGAYSPAPVITQPLHLFIMEQIMYPTVRAMESEGCSFMGFLYAGVMIKDNSAKVLEFNVRMGDPEAQPLLYRMKSDLVPVIIAAIHGTLDTQEILWDDESSVCVVMASKGYPGKYDKGQIISGLEEVAQMENVKVFHSGTALQNGHIVSAGGRVLGVTAKAVGISRAIEKVYEAVHKISWEGVQFRCDIGKKALNRERL
jgi:phosphoribosylamine---glycine ligase